MRTCCGLEVRPPGKARRRGALPRPARPREEYEQPADVVVLGAFSMTNTKLLLQGGIGKPYDPRSGEGVVGRNFCYQVVSSVPVFFRDRWINPFLAGGATQTVIDEFNGDNFDHGGLGFFGGGYISANVSNGRPISSRVLPPGTPRWGSKWKRANADWYAHAFKILVHGCNYPHRENFLDLDPTYRDAYGQPLLRMTYNFHENDYRMSEYVTGKAHEIAKVDGSHDRRRDRAAQGDFDTRIYQTTHTTGGTIMGADPNTSVVSPQTAALGCRQPVRSRLVGLSAQRRLQPDRAAGRAGLAAGRRSASLSVTSSDALGGDMKLSIVILHGSLALIPCTARACGRRQGTGRLRGLRGLPCSGRRKRNRSEPDGRSWPQSGHIGRIPLQQGDAAVGNQVERQDTRPLHRGTPEGRARKSDALRRAEGPGPARGGSAISEHAAMILRAEVLSPAVYGRFEAAFAPPWRWRAGRGGWRCVPDCTCTLKAGNPCGSTSMNCFTRRPGTRRQSGRSSSQINQLIPAERGLVATAACEEDFGGDGPGPIDGTWWLGLCGQLVRARDESPQDSAATGSGVRHLFFRIEPVQALLLQTPGLNVDVCVELGDTVHCVPLSEPARRAISSDLGVHSTVEAS